MTKICYECKQWKDESAFYPKITRKKNKIYTYTTSSCRECVKAKQKEWRLANSEKASEAVKKWRERNRERIRELGKKYYYDHLETERERKRQRDLDKRNTPKGKLSNNVACNIYLALRDVKAGRGWESLVGYTVEQLMKHLEKQFISGMTWDNYGRNGWWVDHIIPKCAFNFTSPEDIDFKRCWALKNLRPLWAKENLIKNGKVQKPFQPSLAISV